MIELSALPSSTSRRHSALPRDEASDAWARQALIAAARAFLAEGRSTVTAKDVTDRAHVSLSFFHSHFSSTKELFDVAVMTTVMEYAQLRDQMVDGIEDPAELYAMGCRINGRMQRRLPQHVKVLLHIGTKLLLLEKDLSSRARQNLAAAVEQGRFDVEDVELAFMTGAGALLGLYQLLDADPTLDADRLSDEFTERLLCALGMDPAEAHELCCTPLPDLPDLI